MTESQLEELGVKAMGDRLRIRAFCERKSQAAAEQKKRQDAVEKLKSMLSHQRASKRSHGRDTLEKKEKKVSKTAIKFEFGWKHWCQEAKTFKQKKKGSGGGTRVLEVPKVACAQDCLEMAKELFFPLGISAEGSLDEMDLTLGDFSGCGVSNVNVDGELLPFTAERYKSATGFTKPRLYLLSKHKLPYDSGDEEDLLRPILPQRDAPEVANGQSQLIGTSKEREEYRDQLARDLAASLQQDRAKEEKKRRKEEERLSAINKEIARAEEEGAQLERLRLSRLERVLPEAKEDESFVVVRVRHTSLGIVTRHFPVDATMWNVYDWIGSLSCTPKYFSLAKDPKEPISPSEGVQISNSHLLAMTVEDDPLPLMEDDHEVAFYGYHLSGETLENTLADQIEDKNATEGKVNSNEGHFQETDKGEDRWAEINDHQVAPVGPELPEVIMEGDESLETEAHFHTLQARRGEEERKLELQRHYVIVDKNNVVKQLLEMYREDEAISNNKLVVSFEGEQANGEGLLRELYSLFWESFFSQNCEGSNQYTLCVSPNLSEEDFTALGRLITHMFIQCGTFPVKLVKASMYQALFGAVSDEIVLDSFLRLLPPAETQMLSDVLSGKKALPLVLDEVLDILDEYQERTRPTSTNLKATLVKIGKAEFVTKLFLPLVKIREGMGKFWDSVTKEEVDSVYELCTPSPTRVIKLLRIVPVDPQESKVERWLRRYLKEADSVTLGLFLRFSTGNDMVLPGSQIKVRFENMAFLAMRPTARTCFQVLTLPRNYQTYHRLRENLDFFIKNAALWDLED